MKNNLATIHVLVKGIQVENFTQNGHCKLKDISVILTH